MKNLSSRYGFSLLELLVAVSIMTVLVTMLYTIFHTSTKVWEKTESKTEMLQNARILLDRISNDLSVATVNPEKNMNFHAFENGVLFVCKAIYQNGAAAINGYQETAYLYSDNDGTDINFTDDCVYYLCRHSQSDSSFEYESDFAALSAMTPQALSCYVADFYLECWDHINNVWMDWDNWPGGSSDPYWDVMAAINSNNPDFASYQPNDASNKGILPEKIRITVKMVPPDIAEFITKMDTASFNSYTQGQSGTNREKIISALEDKGLIEQYTTIVKMRQPK
ncbi:prepilin-type N-terminal cleavage/methylation domain-containing protein [bacterium]|nr:prepilin-type N-terminal cleavage/methylation domain-containing protein [bacterium]